MGDDFLGKKFRQTWQKEAIFFLKRHHANQLEKKAAERSVIPTSTATQGPDLSGFFVPTDAGIGTIACSVDAIRPSIELGGRTEAEAIVVVPILGRVVVAIRNAAILSVVVPAAAAQHTVRALWRLTFQA